ncbi:hypothetical protein [Flavobacterium sp.]|uniref:hypothetical protein n=1 Tax=Flavobacterium sp. TaxID=239 RepID=UPI00262C49CA|nr:hypothetical protein [Flavobacterium sp.]
MCISKIKTVSLCFLLLFLTACNQSNSQNQKVKPKGNPKKTSTVASIFTGNYIASYENASISAELTENQNVVKGFFYMDGVKNELIAISTRNTMKGKLKDKSKNIYYDFEAILNDNDLTFSITFPELDNRVVDLLLKKQGITIDNGNSNLTTTQDAEVYNSKSSAQLNSREKDRRLIGTWRYTEVLSSGYGDNYGSLATDYFIQFKPNGECLSWTGSSAGGTSDVTYESGGNGNVTKEGWYTEGKNVVFYDLNTNEEVSIPFLADENRFLLKGGSTKIYERVN